MRCTLVWSLCIFLLACNSKQPDKTGINGNPTDSLINLGGNNIDSANLPGGRLMAGNDCFTCHRIEQKNIGPSYREIARRYHYNEGNIENLAHKIITGGKGLWGDAAMTPHPNLSEPQAREMARYILSLDSTQ